MIINDHQVSSLAKNEQTMTKESMHKRKKYQKQTASRAPTRFPVHFFISVLCDFFFVDKIHAMNPGHLPGGFRANRFECRVTQQQQRRWRQWLQQCAKFRLSALVMANLHNVTEILDRVGFWVLK